MTVPRLEVGWTRVAEAVAAKIPHGDIARIWIFPPLRREQREWGTAVIARALGDRQLRVFTARYMMIIRGRERGNAKVEVEEIGTTPEDVLDEVLVGVQERSGEPEPPLEISPDVWYGEWND